MCTGKNTVHIVHIVHFSVRPHAPVQIV